MSRPTLGWEKEVTPKELAAAALRLSKRADADIYVLSAEMRTPHIDRLRAMVCRRKSRRSNVILFLTTFGGDADAAYRLGACLKRNYKKITICVSGYCKSAGTLAALCAHEIVLGEFGELGPLDVQLAKRDELLPMSSGLDIFQALAVVKNSAFESFEEYFLSIVTNSGGGMSAKTSAEIARELAVGIFGPLAAQIDPERLGEVQRAINIARSYGQRLDAGNLLKNALERLVQGYPSHGFVIDLTEAKKIFKNVRAADPLETLLGDVLPGARRHAETAIVLDVQSDIIEKAPQNARSKTSKTPRSQKSSSTRASASGTTGTNVAQLRRGAAGNNQAS